MMEWVFSGPSVGLWTDPALWSRRSTTPPFSPRFTREWFASVAGLWQGQRLMLPQLLAVVLALLWSVAAGQTASPQALRPGERLAPHLVATDRLLFDAPAAGKVEVRHSGDGWTRAYPAQRQGDFWELPVAALGLSAGLQEFKFFVDGVWEEGPNRLLYVGSGGQLRPIPSLHLTWRRDPSTTMVVRWHSDEPAEQPLVHWRAVGAEAWAQARGTSAPFPHTTQVAHSVELTGLEPGRRYEFRAGENPETYTFVTAPQSLESPLRFVEGGDVYGDGAVMDRMNRFVGSLDPAFVVLGGDLGYDDGKAEQVGRWLRYLQSWHDHLRAPDGRLIPVVAAIGNHEVNRMRQNEIQPAAMPGDAAARSRLAPFYFATFPFPGDPGYGVLDFGDYLSLVFLDTNHVNLVEGAQTDWLAGVLAARRHITHLLPVYHVPAYPSVRAYDGEVNEAIRQSWLPLFERAGVRLAFEHHDHALKVTPPLREGREDPKGIVFLGDGSWGVGVRDVHEARTTWYLERAESLHGVNEVTLERGQRMVRVLAIDGSEWARIEQQAATGD